MQINLRADMHRVARALVEKYAPEADLDVQKEATQSLMQYLTRMAVEEVEARIFEGEGWSKKPEASPLTYSTPGPHEEKGDD